MYEKSAEKLLQIRGDINAKSPWFILF